MKIRLLAVAAMASATLTAPSVAYAYDDGPDFLDPTTASSPESSAGLDDGYEDDYDAGYDDYDPYVDDEDLYLDDLDELEATEDEEPEEEAEEPAPGVPCSAAELGISVPYEDTELTCVQDDADAEYYYWELATEDDEEDEDGSEEGEDGEETGAPAPGVPCAEEEYGTTLPYEDTELKCVDDGDGNWHWVEVSTTEPEPADGKDAEGKPTCSVSIVGDVHDSWICVHVHGDVYQWFHYTSYNWISYNNVWYWWHGGYWCYYLDGQWVRVYDEHVVHYVEVVQYKTETGVPVSNRTPTSGQLPVTGTALSGLVAVALLLTGVGAALWYLARRRTGATPVT